MADLLSWFGDRLKNVEDAIGGAVNGVGQAVGGAVNTVEHAFQGNQSSQPQQGNSQVSRPAAPRPFNTGASALNVPHVAVPHAVPAPPAINRPQPTSPPPPAPGQQNDLLHTVGNFVNDNVIKPVAQDVSKAYNTVAIPVTGLTGAAMVGADNLFNGGHNADNLAAATKSAVDENVKKSFVPQDIAQGKATPAQFAGDIAKTGIHLAPYAIPGGGGLVDKFGTKVTQNIGNSTAKAVANSLVKSGTNAAIAAPTFAALNAGEQGVDSGFHSFDPSQAVKAGLESGAAVAGTHLAGSVAKAGTNAIKGHVNDITSQPGYNSQTGSIKVPNLGSTKVSSSQTSVTGSQPEISLSPRQQTQTLGKPESKMGLSSSGVNAPQAPQLRLKQTPSQVPVSGEVPQHSSNLLSLANDTIKPSTPQEPVVGNKFTKTVKTSPQVSPEVSKMVSGQHEIRNTNDLIANVQGQIKAEGLKPALNRTLNELAVPAGQTSDATLAKAIEIAKQHDAIGTPAAQNIAANLYDQVAAHGVGKGQGAQILSMIARRSPAGLRNKAFRDLKTAGVPLTDAIKNEIQGHINTIAKMPDGNAKDFAIAVMQKAVAKHLPQSKVDNAVSLWKAGLLSGVKTQGGNLASNATFGALKKVSDIPSTIADKGISLVTGNRAKTFTGKGIASGTKEGLGKGLTTLKTGIDQRNIGDKYEQHAEINFGNKVMQKVLGNPANMIFRGMSAADQPFYYAAMKNSLYDQAKADGLNSGLHGRALSDHMDNLVQNPTDKMAITATSEAQKAVLGNDTMVSRGISSMHQGIDQSSASPAGKQVANAVLNILAPFTKVPSAFISRTIDFTPFGVGKEIFSQIAKGKFDQRSLSQAIGEGLTGAGAIALGIELSKSGLLSGDYPQNDPKKAALWKAQGVTPNSVKIGDRWYTMNYLGPLGLLFNAGDKISTAANGGAQVPDQVIQGIAGMGQGLLNQSFLQGLSGFSDAIKDPARNANSYVNSQAGSIVPSIINDVANATDNMQRQSNDAADAIKARIPGVRESLAPKIDAFGKDLTQASGNSLETAINPLKPSNDNSTPLLSELSRLGQAGQSVFPTTVKSIGSGDNKINLTPDQANQRQKQVGDLLTPLWTSMTKDPAYQKLDDAHKKDALQSALTDVNSAVDYKLAQQIDTAKSGKPPTGNVASILNGTSPTPSTYLDRSSAKQAGTAVNASSNDAEYKTFKTQYDQKVKAGSYSPAQKVKADAELKRLQVGSAYPKSTRDAYSLTKVQLSNLISTDKNGKAIAGQVLAYGDALVSAGVVKTNKFRDGSGNLSFATKKSVARKSSGGTRRVAKAKTISISSALSTANRIKPPKVAKAPSFSKSVGGIKPPTFRVPKISDNSSMGIKPPTGLKVKRKNSFSNNYTV